MLHIYHSRKERIFNPDSLRLEIQALTDFLCSNKIEILSVAGPRESKEPGVYAWTLTMLRCFLNRAVFGAGSTETARAWVPHASEWKGGVGKSGGAESWTVGLPGLIFGNWEFCLEDNGLPIGIVLVAQGSGLRLSFEASWRQVRRFMSGANASLGRSVTSQDILSFLAAPQQQSMVLTGAIADGTS
jgi:hypothetical protein